MITILYQGLAWIVFLLLLTALCLLFLWMWSNITAKVPFVSVPTRILKDIEKALQLDESSVVYDLGCGDGRVLFFLYKNNPKAKYIGIEDSPFPYLLASIKNWWHKKIYKSDILIMKSDFFNVDISNATHIFTYLYPDTMDDLLPKFDNDLKRGTRLVSVSFHFTSKKELELIELKRNKWEITKKIYVYKF